MLMLCFSALFVIDDLIWLLKSLMVPTLSGCGLCTHKISQAKRIVHDIVINEVHADWRVTKISKLPRQSLTDNISHNIKVLSPPAKKSDSSDLRFPKEKFDL